MGTIEKFGVRFIYGFKLLPKAFAAITLFGRVYTNMDKAKLQSYLLTYSGEVMANHEKIHMIQAKSFKLGYFAFYALYIWHWIANLFTIGFNINAYYNIPFEKEAYANERDFNYAETHWRKYK